MVASAYSLAEDIGESRKTFVEYVVELKNPNSTYHGSFPEYDITAYGPHHRVQGTDQQTLGEFPPGATLYWADQIEARQPVTSVKITYSGIDWSRTVTTPADYPPFPASGVHYSGGYDPTITGVIKNPYPRAFGEIAVTAAFYMGESLVGGGTDFVDHLPANSSKPFSLSLLSKPPPNWQSIVVTAVPWGSAPNAWNQAALKLRQTTFARLR